MSDLKEFFQSKAGVTLLHDIHRIADCVDKVANPVQVLTVDDGNVTSIPIPKKDDVMAAFDAFIEQLKAERRAPLDAHLTKVIAERAKLRHVFESAQDWQFTRIEPFFSQSYRFRQEQNGFYHFIATLLGYGPDQIFALNIMGDCGSDTYRCGDTCSVREFAHWIGRSDPQYLLSKGTVKQGFHKDKAREDMQAFFKEYAHAFGDDPESPDPTLLAQWRQLGEHIDIELRSGCANTSDLYHLVEDCADQLDAPEEVCERFKEYITTDFSDHSWGEDYDAMDYARIEQARWFGLWLLQQFGQEKGT